MKQNILDLLRTHPGLTTRQICASLGKRSGSVSKCLTRLVQARFIFARANPQGKRIYSLSLFGKTDCAKAPESFSVHPFLAQAPIQSLAPASAKA